MDNFYLAKEVVMSKLIQGKNVKKSKSFCGMTMSLALNLVLVAGHAFTIEDGVLIDNRGEEFRPTRKVTGAYKVEREVIDNQLQLF